MMRSTLSLRLSAAGGNGLMPSWPGRKCGPSTAPVTLAPRPAAGQGRTRGRGERAGRGVSSWSGPLDQFDAVAVGSSMNAMCELPCFIGPGLAHDLHALGAQRVAGRIEVVDAMAMWPKPVPRSLLVRVPVVGQFDHRVVGFVAVPDERQREAAGRVVLAAQAGACPVRCSRTAASRRGRGSGSWCATIASRQSPCCLTERPWARQAVPTGSAVG